MVDWDNSGGGRSQRVEILNASNVVIDSQSVSGFNAGKHLVWNMSGRVSIRVVNRNLSSEAVVSGLFFGPATSTPPPPPSGSLFVKTDTTTQGSWKGVYGQDGYVIANQTPSVPSYVTVSSTGTSYTWTPSTADTRALQKGTASDRFASCWYQYNSFTLDLNFTDGQTHQVALYMVDWDNSGGGRSQRVEILNASNVVVDTQTVTAFNAGKYLVWNLSGHMYIRVVNLNMSSEAVVSGLFFGPATTSTPGSLFVKTDTTTQGSWKGVYGQDGYAIANQTASYPSYVTVSTTGTPYTWASSTLDTRALQKATASDRFA